MLAVQPKTRYSGSTAVYTALDSCQGGRLGLHESLGNSSSPLFLGPFVFGWQPRQALEFSGSGVWGQRMMSAGSTSYVECGEIHEWMGRYS